ncbi:MAG TPA: Ig domain-containing protein, partial [Blastocatellia bacterium]|nr:Ig domain-containing protein [Blastocatellia bacterium]
GLPPYTWAISSGSLPPGITLNFASGTVSGVPTSVGNYTSQITVTDAQFNSVNAVLNINVTPPVPVPLISGLIYKKVHHKLVINGQNFNPAATVLVDGFLAPIKTTAATSIIVKPVSLTAGDHTVQVINPNGVSSGPVVITVP